MRRLCATALSILLAMGWLVTPLTAAQAAPPAKPAASPGHPVRGVAFSVAGRLPTKVARPVELQRKSGSKWVKIASATTASSGRYSFSTTQAVSTAQLRVYAAKVKIGKKTYPRLTSKVSTVKTVAVTPSSPMAGEAFTVVESLGKKGTRPATLQRQSGRSWVNVQTVTTNAAGTATFSASLSASASLRVYAPKTKIKKKTYSKITVATFRVAISAQSGSLSLPTTGITGQALVAQTQFSPVRAGRTVELQQQVGSDWVTVATSTQDAAGKATLGVSPSAAGTFVYRATTSGYHGAAATSTSTAQAVVASGVPEPSIVIGTLDTAVTGDAYHTTLEVVGGTGPFTWSATGLPEGLELSDKGVLSGTPTTPGTYDVQISITDANGKTAHRQTTIVVVPVVGIDSTSLPAGIAAQDYTATMVGSGGTKPYHWSTTGLPEGLSISDDGVITGSTNTAGDTTVTVTVTDNNGKTASKDLMLSVGAALALTTETLPNGTVGLSYSETMAATGGATPYSWSATGLPDGLTLKAETGEITGTPTRAATFDTVSITVTDDNDYTATATFSITIAATFAITTTSLPAGVVGTTYAETTLATDAGTPPFTWAATGLPAGLDVKTDTGVISGTPTESGTFDAVKITVSDSASHSTEATFSITVAPAVQISKIVLPDGVVGSVYSATQLVATHGSDASYSWTATGLPKGLELSTDGKIAGTPTEAGTFDAVTVTVTDAGGATAEATLTIVVAPAVHITTTELPAGVVGTDYSATLAAADGNGGPYSWSSSTMPDGLTLSASGVISGTPTSAGVYESVKVTATDAGGASTEATFTVTVIQTVHITTAGLPNGVVGTSYPETTLAAADGTAPYTWTATGLPDGLTLTSAGVLSGTPTKAGDFTVKITVADHDGKTAEATFSITIAKAVHITTATTLPAGVVGTSYPDTQLTAADGNSATYSWTSSTLPEGLELSTSGVLTGTPSAEGAFDAVKITVTDAGGKTAEATFSITIAKAVHITTATLPAGVVGTSYPETTLAAADGNAASYSWASSTLPEGLSLSAAGKITGTPTTDGTFDAVKITVTDAGGNTAEATYSITIAKAVHITTATLPAGVVGTSYADTQLTAADGNSATYSWTSTALPAGLELSTTGKLTGTPTADGVTTVTFTAADTKGKTATVELSITITKAVHITTDSLPDGVRDEAYPATTVTALDGTGPYAWSATGLPIGLALDPESGALSGTPTTAGTWDAVKITATDSRDKTTTQTLSITIHPVMAVTTVELAAGVMNEAYSATLSGLGGIAPREWKLTGLPAGLSLNTATGEITGSPTEAGTFDLVATLTDANHREATRDLSLTIRPVVHITNGSLPAGVAGTAYTATLAAADGTAGYSWSSTSLPEGLTLDAATGTISGTPAADGTTVVTFTVTDTHTKTATAELSITIAKAVHITTASLPAGIVGTSYPEATLAAADGNSASYSWASTTLPAGLELSTGGVLTGTPTTDGTFDAVKITVTDHAGKTAEAVFSITIAKAVHITTASLPAGVVGTAYAETTLAAADGNSASYSWASTTLPAGLELSTGGILTGTPTASGVYDSVKVTVTDHAGKTAEAVFSIVIAKAVHITTASLPAGVVGTSYPETTLTAADGNSASYSWASTTLPAGLNLSTSGVLTGAPTTDGTFDAVKITVTDAGGKTAEAVFSITVTKAVHITTATLPAGIVGTSYPETAMTAADGNSASYSWASTTLPAGLELSTGGVLTGAPTTDGTYDAVTITVTDHAGKTAEAVFSIVIAKAVHITTATLPAGVVGTTYAETTLAAADGNSASYSWASTTLPAGLSLSEAGVLSGTPTTDGTYDAVKITVTDHAGKTAETVFSIVIAKAVHITTSSLPSVEAGDAYPETTLAAADGTPGYTWNSSALPIGLSLSEAGVLTGTPTTDGTTAVTFTVTDAGGKAATAELSITITAAVHLSSTLSIGVVGGDYTSTLTADGGTAPYTISATSLPDGLTFTDGVISGTPTTAGTNTPVQISVTDSRGKTSTTAPGLTVVKAAPQAAGASHTCAITPTGGVECWGDASANGQLGDGTTTSSNYPVKVAALGGKAISLSAGNYFTCALLSNGKIDCWGYNSYGQLGVGDTLTHTTVVEVSGIDSAVTIAAGAGFACATLSHGTGTCWGSGAAGQLGDGAKANRTTPVPVSSLTGVMDVEVGSFHACALTTSGTVSCWGRNNQRQLGAGAGTTSQVSTPVAVPDILPATSLSTHLANHSCVTTTSGTVQCWGSNNSYQLGATSPNPSMAAVTVADLTDASAVVVGASHSCAITTTGAMRCWGSGGSGRLGDGSPVGSTNTATAVTVALTDPATSASAGAGHTCATLTTGAMECWGSNTGGQLATGSSGTITTPLTIAAISNKYTALTMGDDFTCGLTASGGVECWGQNSYGQLGNGTTLSSGSAVQVTGLTSGVTAIDAGGSHACAITSGGGVTCWGNNTDGKLGNSSTVDSSTPVAVSGLSSGATAVSAGGTSTCALMTTGTLQCWGTGSYGALGDNSFTASSAPVTVTNISDATAIVVGGFHACAATASVGVECWGNSGNGTLGNAGVTQSVNHPVPVTNLTTGVTGVAAGYNDTCAINNGALMCWGANGSGQVGDGTTSDAHVATAVTGLSSGVASVAVGTSHVCALTTGGGVKCWGDNSSRQLGYGTATQSSTPIDVPGLTSGVSSIVAGNNSTCALLTDGTVKCWGSNSGNQLGISTAYSSTPLAPIGFNVPALAATSSSLDAGVVGTAYSGRDLTATGGVAPYTWTSPDLPAGLSLSSDGVLSGTPTADGTSDVTFTVTDVRGKTASATASITITPAVHITSDAALPGGVMGTAYSTQLAAAAGTGPYTWASDQVPPGLTLSQDGLLSGTPTGTTPSTTMQITVTDHTGKTDTKAITIVITPVIQGAAALNAGSLLACAVTDAGGVECWGKNQVGQLGGGTVTPDSTTPVQVVGLGSGVRTVVAGASHACALTDAGGVKCWGTNQLGQLGDGSPMGLRGPNTPYNSPTPVDVVGLSSGVKAISAGANHTCALTNAGAVKCWGYNVSGALGNNSNTSSNVPVDVAGLTSGITAIAGTNASTCALTSAGAVKCWGNNSNGQVGDGSLTERWTPADVALPLGTTAMSLTARGRTACVVTDTSGVVCWGYNGNGQFGNGSTTDSATPVLVANLSSGIAAVAQGQFHACALTTAGAVKCWGDNSAGEVGDGTATNRPDPVSVTGLSSGVASVSVGSKFACAVLDNGTTKCWGLSDASQLGNGFRNSASTPTTVFGYGPVSLHIATSGLPTGEAGIAYPATTINRAGGTAPYTWAATGLPNGLSINANTGVISGTPTEAGTFNAVKVTLTDSTDATAETTLSLTTIAGVRVTTSGLPDGLVGASYPTTTVAAADGAAPYVWSATGLPAGLSLNASTGEITGTPTAYGVFSVAITATDQNKYAATTTIPLTVLAIAGAASDFISMDGGNSHTCAVNNVGGVECWGNNTQGQLGNGTTTLSLAPVKVSGLSSGATSVTTANNFGCALTSAGGVKCWGTNTYGQLGNSSTITSTTPVDVTGLTSGVTAITAGNSFACALTSTGGVKCWGFNTYGQLGNDTTTASSTPVDVTGLTSGVTAITTGSNHVCAVTSAGVKCWGSNGNGQLGNNTTTASSTPVDVTGLASGVTAITSGGLHTCAVVSGGVKCWGYNLYGQLGNNTTTDAHTPVDVTGLASGVTAITAGGTHTCAVTSGGGVKCWGYNPYGQLGNNTIIESHTPVDVAGLASGVTAVTAGANHTCAVTSGHDVACWGANSLGQLGNGQRSGVLSPITPVSLGSGVAAAASGYNHTCALTSGGGVKCWGANGNGQLGNATTTASSTAVDVSGLTSGVTAVAGGGSHTCALTATGGVKCWGSNGNGQLGNATTTDSSIPVDVTGLASGVAAITAGGSHTCALTTTGGVKCWGNNFAGAVGDATTNDRYTPVGVSGLTSGVTAITAGGSHTCALTTTGGVKCWGYNEAGELGDGTTTASSTAVNVSGLTSGATAVDAGGSETCALTTDGGVKCWGYNNYGQLGNGTTADSGTPVNVSGLSTGAAAINVGGYHACAVTSTGGIKCWGQGAYGQLGNGATTSSGTPVDVTDLTSAVSTVTAGNQHTCAVTTTGGLTCWGSNALGQVGNGDFITLVPGAVVGHTFTPTATPLSITTVGLSSGTVSSAYSSASLVGTGGVGPYSWSATNLPAGITLSSAGVWGGTPTAAGSTNVTITATDAGGHTINKTLNLTVNAALAISTTSLTAGMVGSTYSSTALAATGGTGSYTWSATGIPTGITLSPAGAWGGTPTAASTASVTLTVTDTGGHTINKTLSLTVTSPVTITITTSSLATGLKNADYHPSGPMAATGGTAPYTWVATNLPPGITLHSDGTFTGLPTSSGTWSITFTATDSAGHSGMGALPLTVGANGPPA